MRTSVAIAGGTLTAVFVAVLIAIFGGGDNTYRVEVHADNANGLREGSEVHVGGVNVGAVRDLHVTGDEVRIEIELTKDDTPIGLGASAAIGNVNLLGHKYVALDRGDVDHPLPSGSSIARARVTNGTDLDQVLNVVDADTRTRMQVLINELGTAVAGRRAEFRELMAGVPRSFDAGTRLLRALVRDNRTLDSLVDHSDKLVGTVVRERKALGREVDSVGRAARSASHKREALKATLARAPQTLSTARRFLTELDATAAQLGPAARRITSTAPSLRAALAQAAPFTADARPALAQARASAPALTKLGKDATPVIRAAVDTTQALAALSHASPASSRGVRNTIDDALGTLEGWARVIQFRDGLGHIFRGTAAVSPDAIASLLSRMQQPSRKSHRTSRPQGAAPRLPALTKRPKPAGGNDSSSKPTATNPVEPLVEGLLNEIGGLLNRQHQQEHPGTDDGQALLDFLLKP